MGLVRTRIQVSLKETPLNALYWEAWLPKIAEIYRILVGRVSLDVAVVSLDVAVAFALAAVAVVFALAAVVVLVTVVVAAVVAAKASSCVFY